MCSTHTAAIMFTPHLKLKMFTHWNDCSVSSTEFCVQMKVANHPINAKCLLEVLRCDMIYSICWYFLRCNLQIKPYAWIEYQDRFIINKFDWAILLYRTIIIHYCNNSTLLIYKKARNLFEFWTLFCVGGGCSRRNNLLLKITSTLFVIINHESC